MKGWYKRALLLVALVAIGSTSAWAQHLIFRTGPSTHGGAPNIPLIFDFESIQDDTLTWSQYNFTPGNPDDNRWLYIDSFVGVGGSPQHGLDAMWMDWSFITPETWGGNALIETYLPKDVLDAGTFFDVSDFTHIGIWFNNLSQADPEAFYRFKLLDASNNTGGSANEGANVFEHWYSETHSMFNAGPGWTLYTVPLVDMGQAGCCHSNGFVQPGWSGASGNSKFDMNKLAGFQLEFNSGVILGDQTAEGNTVWDNFHVSGVRYNTLSDFEGNPTTHSKQSNGGTYTLSNSTDAILGSKSLKVDYSVVGDQSWGGEVDLFFKPEGGAATFGDMSARTGITVFYKVVTPSSTPMTFGLRVHETNGELWASERTDVLPDASGNWRRYTATFKDMTIPSWSSVKDGKLDQADIAQVQFVLYTVEGNTTTGSILFDRMTGYGFQETDNQAPVAVTGFAASPGDFNNVISWTDVPGEDGEKYLLYVSETRITDVTAPGVSLMAEVGEGVEAYVHPLYYPVNNNSLAFWYAIVPVDRVGNVGPAAATTAALRNNARGIVTVALTTPGGFAADGVLSEWAGVTPIHLEVGTMFGHSAGTLVPSNGTDLSADVYIAMDKDNLYLAMDVTDEVYDPYMGTGDGWMFDVAELYIGLYDGRGGKHAGYSRSGNAVDYKFNIYNTRAWMDNSGLPWEATNGDGNFVSKARSGGWVLELRVPFTAMTKAGDPVFVPEAGIRVPLDIVIMDDDTKNGVGNRDGILTYSPYNNDNSWQSPSNWLYTWIGNAYATGVEAISAEIPTDWALHQNYPNPFNPTTTFRYDVKETGRVTLKIFNILGQEIETLVNADQTAGQYEVHFDASQLTSGMYMYQLKSGNFVQSRKMLLVR